MMNASEVVKEYPGEIISKVENICSQIRAKTILTEIGDTGTISPKIMVVEFGKILKKIFPHLTNEQVRELYNYGMFATR